VGAGDLLGAAVAIPFRAGVDAEGRLSTLTADIPAAAGQGSGGTCRMAFSDYGKAATPAAPPADQVAGTGEEKIYEILNS
jgi:hypothetical protein